MPYKNKEDLYRNQEKHRMKNFLMLVEYLSERTCIDCGNDDWRVLEFDHLPEYTKKFDISKAIAGSTRSWNSILKEIEKCEVICANCHRIRTGIRGDFKRFLI